MKKLITLFALFIIVGVQAASAQKIIKGTVVDDKGETIPMATIIAVGKPGLGVAADFDGKYLFEVPDDVKQLTFSAVGYETQTVDIGNKTVLDVTMNTGKLLDDVEIIGDVIQKKRDIAGSISTVSSEVLESRPLQSIDKAMQGQAAGVQVTANSGVPGGAVTVRVRGTNSINAGNDPIYIVDGVQISSGDLTQISTSQNALSGLNPEDIADIQILKDAATTAIYGAKGGNGVVLITTKKGKAGRPRFNFSASQGFVTRIKKMDMCSAAEWARLKYEAITNNGSGDSSALRSADRKIWDLYVETLENPEQYKDGFYTDVVKKNRDKYPVGDFSLMPSYDWQDEAFRTGHMRDFMLSVTGGTDKIGYFVSGSYSKSEGQIISSDFERLTLRANLDVKLSEKFKTETNISISRTGQHTVPDGGYFSNPYNSALAILPFNRIRNQNGNFNTDDLIGTYTTNSIAQCELGTRESEVWSVIGREGFTFKFNDNLSYRGSASFEFMYIPESDYMSPLVGDGSRYRGYISESSTKRLSNETKHNLNYIKSFSEDHEVNILTGMAYSTSQTSATREAGNGIPSPRMAMLGATGSPVYVTSGYYSSSDFRIYGRMSYTMFKKYVVTASITRDGSSRFGSDTRYGTFPSLALAWNIQNENFMKNNTFVDELKLRLNWGISGNSQISNYGSYGYFGAYGNYMGLSGMKHAQIANPDLSWENIASYSLGIDFSFWNGRVNGTLEGYWKETSDMLLQRQLPTTTGFSSRYENVGALENRGVDINVTARVLQLDDFSWEVRANYSHTENKVTELVDGLETMEVYSGSDLLARIKIGQPVGTNWMHKWAGVNPADGRPMYYDKDGNISYNLSRQDDREWLNTTPNPPNYGGLTNTFTYKGLELQAHLMYAYGHHQYNGSAIQFANSANDELSDVNGSNQWTSIYEDRWQKPGDVTWVPKPMDKDNYYGASVTPTNYSTRQLEKMDFLRLKTVTVSYNFPKSIYKKIGLGSLRIYATGTNLWTLTNYKSWDPEFSGRIEWGTYPQGKSYTFGIKASF